MHRVVGRDVLTAGAIGGGVSFAGVIGMIKPAAHIPVAKTLAEQEEDFTAEGAPPPGKVPATNPIRKHQRVTATQAPAKVRATMKLKRAARPANP